MPRKNSRQSFAKMMAKDPEDRYQDMTHFLSDLAKTEIYKAGKRPEGYKK